MNVKRKKDINKWSTELLWHPRNPTQKKDIYFVGTEPWSFVLRVKRLAIGIWLGNADVGWHWLREAPVDKAFWYIAFGIGEVRWYKKGK